MPRFRDCCADDTWSLIQYEINGKCEQCHTYLDGIGCVCMSDAEQYMVLGQHQQFERLARVRDHDRESGI